jgi:hypothetical protein
VLKFQLLEVPLFGTVPSNHPGEHNLSPVIHDFAAKVRWRMAHDRNPVFPILQDKVAVKEYAMQRGVASPELLFVTDDPSSIQLDQLPDSCFIKANHGCGWNFLRQNRLLYFFGNGNALLTRDGDLVEGTARSRFLLSRDRFVDLCWQMLRARHSKQEWAYQLIQPRILAEEMLQSETGGELMDYRFYVFHGVVRAINVGSASYRRNHENVFLSPDWLPFQLTRYKERIPDLLPARPDGLNEMVQAAERLGRGLDFVRVDLYQSTRGIMLGEMTLYPEAGHPDTPTGCARFNQWLADAWQSPSMPITPSA